MLKLIWSLLKKKQNSSYSINKFRHLSIYFILLFENKNLYANATTMLDRIKLQFIWNKHMKTLFYSLSFAYYLHLFFCFVEYLVFFSLPSFLNNKNFFLNLKIKNLKNDSLVKKNPKRQQTKRSPRIKKLEKVISCRNNLVWQMF